MVTSQDFLHRHNSYSHPWKTPSFTLAMKGLIKNTERSLDYTHTTTKKGTNNGVCNTEITEIWFYALLFNSVIMIGQNFMVI